MSLQDYPHPETIGDPDDLIGDEGLGGGEEPEQPSGEDQLAKLREELSADFERRMREQDERYQGTIRTLMERAQPAGNEPDGDLQLDDLPDPVEDPKAYHAELKKRLSEFTTRTTQRATQDTRQQFDQQQRASRLWDEFKTEHPDLAGREALVSGAAQFEATAMRNAGRDPLADPAEFKRRVAERAQRELEGAGGTQRKPSGRTAGLSGGTKSTPGGNGRDPKQPPGFLQQLRKAQQQSGLI